MCSRNKRSYRSVSYELFPSLTHFSCSSHLGFDFERFLDPRSLAKAISECKTKLIKHIESKTVYVSLDSRHGCRVPQTNAIVHPFTNFSAIAAAKKLQQDYGIDTPVYCDVYIEPEADFVFNSAVQWLVSCQSHGENWAFEQIDGPTLRAIRHLLKAGAEYRKEPFVHFTSSQIETLKNAGFLTGEDKYLLAEEENIALKVLANDN